ncbi:SAL1 phosphatase [Bienertia sinuspersici]
MVTSLFKLLNLYHHSLLFQDSGDLRKGCAHDTLECIRLHINDTIASDKLTTPMMFHLYRMKLCWLLSIMAGLKEHLLVCKALGQSGYLFSALIGEGTYMEPLDGSSPVKVNDSLTENTDEASFFESYQAAQSSHDLSTHSKTSHHPTCFQQKRSVKAPLVRIDSKAKYGALSRDDGAIYLCFPVRRHNLFPIFFRGVVSNATENPLDFSKGKYLDLYKGYSS